MPDTCGIINVHWSGVLSAAMVEAIADIGRIDDRLPPRFAHDPEALTAAVAQRLTQLRSDLQTLDPVAIAAAAARRFWVAGGPGVERPTGASAGAGAHGRHMGCTASPGR